MEEAKFLGVKRETLTVAGVVFAPSFTMLLAVVALFSVMNANMNRLNSSLTAIAAQGAANGAAIESLRLDVREVNDDLDALSAEVIELRLETVEIKGRVANIEAWAASIEGRVTIIESRVTNIERNLPDVESVNSRLDNLEREQAALTGRVDALAAAE